MSTNYIKLYTSCINLTRLVPQITLPTRFKTSEFFKKSPLSGAEIHSDFTVTLWHPFETTNPNFAYIKSEYMLVFCENTDVFQQFSMCNRIKYMEEKKYIAYIILLEISTAVIHKLQTHSYPKINSWFNRLGILFCNVLKNIKKSTKQ